MKTDPKQLFVISQISRRDIARILNNAIDAAGATDVDRFTGNDPRLTDNVCREVADLIYDADSAHDDGMEEANMSAADTFLGSMKAGMRKKPRVSKRARK